MLRSFSELTGWNASLALLLLKATIILVAALGITLTMRRASATARHLVWLVTLGTLLLVPILTAWGPLRVAILPATDTQVSRLPSVARNDIAAEQPSPASMPSAADVREPTAPAATSNAMNRAIDAVSAMSPLTLFAMVWVIVVGGILLSLTWAGLAVRRIVRNAKVLSSDDWMTPLFEISDRLALEEPPRLLQSVETKMPFACGVMKATIVLPAESEAWTLERRRAVLLHELAHVRRHDLLGHTLGRVACAVYWFHPLVWKAAKQLRNESERACDDLALSCGTRATDYAEHLLDIVTTVRGDSTPLVALAMARRKEFEGRMLAILDPDLRRAGPTRRQSTALIAALALIALTVGAASPVARTAVAATVVDAKADPVSTPFAAPEAPQQSSMPVLHQKQAYPDSGVRDVVQTHYAMKTDTTVHVTTNTTATTTVNGAASASASASASPNKELQQLGESTARLGMSVAASVLDGIIGQKTAKGAKSDERIDLLAKVLRNDTSASVRRIAAWGLQEYTRSSVAMDALVNALRKDSDVRVREMSAWALGEGGDHSSAGIDALNTAVKSDASEKVRATAAWALGNVGDHGVTDGLVAALGDQDSGVRIRAAWALGGVGIRRAPPALVALLNDKESRVRMLAAWSLHNIEDPSTASALNAAMKKEQSSEVQLAMLKALASLGEQSVDAIKDLLESSDPRVKQMAVRALAGGHPTGPWPWPWPEPRPFP